MSERFTNEAIIRSCINKQRFSTKQEAGMAKGRAKKRGVKLGIYKCKNCRGFHLTSLPARREKHIEYKRSLTNDR